MFRIPILLKFLTFPKVGFMEILKTSFSAKFFKKTVKIDAQTLDKAKIVKINGEKILALPPESRK